MKKEESALIINYVKMNLYQSPSISQLNLLIENCKNCNNYFNVIVDYDGKAFIGNIAAGNLIYLNQLYKNLIYCWDKDLNGEIDFNKISSLFNLNYWLEINQIPKASIENDIISIFFKSSGFLPHRRVV